MGQLEPELRGGADSGEEDVLEVDVGRLEGAVEEQRRQTVGEPEINPNPVLCFHIYGWYIYKKYNIFSY